MKYEQWFFGIYCEEERTCHADNIANPLQRLHDSELVFRCHPVEYAHLKEYSNFILHF